MRISIDLNQRSHRGDSPGSGTSWIDQRPNEQEYPGYALCIVKGKTWTFPDVHSEVFQSSFGQEELVMLLYKQVGAAPGSQSQPRDCRVELMGHVAGMSQKFQLKSGRQGYTVKLWRLVYPGQGAVDAASVEYGEAEALYFNVVEEDFSTLNGVESILRPAYDVKINDAFTGDVLTAKWEVDALNSSPSQRATGQVAWYSVNAEGQQSLGQINVIWRFAAGGVSPYAEAWDPEQEPVTIQEAGDTPSAWMGEIRFSQPIAVMAGGGTLCWSCALITPIVEGENATITIMSQIIRSDTNAIVGEADVAKLCYVQTGPTMM